MTGEYRGNATFHGLDKYEGGFDFGGGTNEYTSIHKCWSASSTAMSISAPGGASRLIGGGIGWAKNSVEGFTDVNNGTIFNHPDGFDILNSSVHYGRDKSESGFAWAIQCRRRL